MHLFKSWLRRKNNVQPIFQMGGILIEKTLIFILSSKHCTTEQKCSEKSTVLSYVTNIQKIYTIKYFAFFFIFSVKAIKMID